MFFENFYLKINNQLKSFNDSFDFLESKLVRNEKGINIFLRFKRGYDINNVCIAFDIKDFKIVFMPTVQDTKNGLVFSNRGSHLIVLEKEGLYYLIASNANTSINNNYFRFCSKVVDELLYIGFFSSFMIDEENYCFYYQNNQVSYDVNKDVTIIISIEFIVGSSLFDCISKYQCQLNKLEPRFELNSNNKNQIISINKLYLYDNSDLAKYYNFSLLIPSKFLKVKRFFYPLVQNNYKIKYTASIQNVCLYYLRLVEKNLLSDDELQFILTHIDQFLLSGKYCHNFYHNNIMLTEIKTYYHLPYVLLSYLKICIKLGKCPLSDFDKLLDEVYYYIIMPSKFFSDDTIVSFDDYSKQFENKIFASETMTIYICYELYKLSYRYYENTKYKEIEKLLKAFLYLYHDTNTGLLFKNNYTNSYEMNIKLIERKDLR